MLFGFSFWVDRDAREVADLVVAAEGAGFDFAWFPDHYFLREVYAVQALAAAKTSRIKLATGVTSPYLRHPALLASATATLDEFSGGRAVLGIGAGGFEFATQLGIHWKRPLTGCRESVEIIRRLFRGSRSTFKGKSSASGARASPSGGPSTSPSTTPPAGRRCSSCRAKTATASSPTASRGNSPGTPRRWSPAPLGRRDGMERTSTSRYRRTWRSPTTRPGPSRASSGPAS